jgi:hypothetical protein
MLGQELGDLAGGAAQAQLDLLDGGFRAADTFGKLFLGEV